MISASVLPVNSIKVIQQRAENRTQRGAYKYRHPSGRTVRRKRKDQAEIPSDVGTLGTEVHRSLCFTHTRVIYKVYTQEENVANDSNPLSWAELLRFASPTNRRRNSRPMGSRHYLRFHLAEALSEIRSVGKRSRKWNLYKVG